MTNRLHLNFDIYESPADAVDALALARFLDGSQPFARTQKIERVRVEARLLPPGVDADLVATTDERTAMLVRAEGWTLRVVRSRDQSAVLAITAVTDELAEHVLAEAREGAAEPLPERDVSVRATFTHLGVRGPVRHERDLRIEPWSGIRRNYSRGVATALDTLMTMRPESLAGRLLLMHGPPGTGKTTALRALANAWRDWCDLEFVVDPERLLQNAGYLTSFLLGDDDERADRWRLLILEDCDELIRSGAKSGSGQALGRLLNLTDGLLGQGLSVLVAITTNEPLERLHPAVTRPGRCLAEIEVGPLDADEVRLRLSGRLESFGPKTLAEVLAMETSSEPLTRHEPPTRVGQYL